MTEAKETKTAAEKIHDAYVALCETKPYYKIKVSDVVAKAGINRTTFYKHYAGMPDLILSMYRRYMKLLMQVPAGMTIRTPEELEAYVRSIWARLMARRDEVKRIMHQDGVMRLMITYCIALAKKLKSIAKKANLNDDYSRQLVDYAPYMMIWSLVIEVTHDDLLHPVLGKEQHVFDLSRSLQENLARYMETELGGNVDFHYDLFGAYLKLSGEKDYDKITVTELLETAGISRTQFYLYYRNMEDFTYKYFYCLFELAIEFALNICRRPDVMPEEQLSVLRNTTYQSYTRKTLQRLFRSGKIINEVAFTLANLFERYREAIETEYNVSLNDDQIETLKYYICKMTVESLRYYIGTVDYETYSRKVKAAKAAVDLLKN